MLIILTNSEKPSCAFAIYANAWLGHSDFQIGERFIIPNSEFRIVQNLWGLDIDGTLQGAGGVGGLLSVNSYTSTNNSPFSILHSQLCFPTYDANGNISEYVTASSGNIVAHYDYSPFGEQILASGEMAQTFTHRFSTKPFCQYTGLIEYQYRKYHPSLGRWLSRDPIGEQGGVNLYAMCGNNGIDNYDIYGKLDASVYVEGVGTAWAGSIITLNGQTAVKLNDELYYFTMKAQRGMRIPRSGSSSAVFLFKGDNPKKGLRIDYHKIPLNSNNPKVWHSNVDGSSGVAKVTNSKVLDHAISVKAKLTGKTVTVFKQGGKIVFIAGVAMSAVDIYKAENKVREITRQVGGHTGALLGGKYGAKIGAAAGMKIALWAGQSGPQALTPEELLTVPVFGTIGGVIGGLGGGVVGYFSGARAADKVYDWSFTPLEKEEWSVGCVQ